MAEHDDNTDNCTGEGCRDELVTVSQTVEESPPRGPQSNDNGERAWPLPGRIQAGNFDSRGSEAAVADKSTDNIDDASRETQVDRNTPRNTDASDSVYRMDADEWLEYLVDLASTGTYDVTLSVASPHSETVTLEVSVGATDLGPVAIPETDSWEDDATVTFTGQALSGGEQVLRISVVDAGGNECACELDRLEVHGSEYETVSQAIDADDDGTIEHGGILTAIDHRQSGEPVPNTGGGTVTDGVVTDLVKRWQDERDVSDGN